VLAVVAPAWISGDPLPGSAGTGGSGCAYLVPPRDGVARRISEVPSLPCRRRGHPFTPFRHGLSARVGESRRRWLQPVGAADGRASGRRAPRRWLATHERAG
jgi:hypothetical protein